MLQQDVDQDELLTGTIGTLGSYRGHPAYGSTWDASYCGHRGGPATTDAGDLEPATSRTRVGV